MSYILFSISLDLPLARVDADPASAVLTPDQLALPCAADADVDDVAHWRELAVSLPEPTEAELLLRAKSARLAEINAGCQTALAALTPTYPERELTTFDKQETEARAWLADSGTPTPFLSALAAARGIELAELARRVVAKADAFAVASGHLVGQRQRMEDALDACATVEDVLALEVVFGLPGGDV